jgi:hypothetical protein
MGPTNSFFSALKAASQPRTEELLSPGQTDKLGAINEQKSDISLPKIITVTGEDDNLNKTEIKFKKRLS